MNMNVQLIYSGGLDSTTLLHEYKDSINLAVLIYIKELAGVESTANRVLEDVATAGVGNYYPTAG